MDLVLQKLMKIHQNSHLSDRSLLLTDSSIILIGGTKRNLNGKLKRSREILKYDLKHIK